MSGLRIYKYGEKILREKAQPVSCVTSELAHIADEMLMLMRKAGGVGLAAPQVGRTERMCVIELPEDFDDGEDGVFNAPIPMPLKLWNPVIVAREGSVRDKEGCLSFPNVGGSIVRAREVTVQYLDEKNCSQMLTCRGYLARAVQHEVDHLEGVLYVDHMSAVERLSVAGKLKKLARQNGGVR